MSSRSMSRQWQQQRQRKEGVPSDVLVEILLRLPLECLARFKSVDKEWNSSISNPYFFEEYRTRKLVEGYHHHHQLIFAQYLPSTTQLYTIKCHDDDLTNNTDNHRDQQLLALLSPLKIPHQLMKNDQYRIPPKLLGSYNGLIAMLVKSRSWDSDFILWNPLTNTYMSSSFNLRLIGDMSNSLLGLCYDYSSHAYVAVVATKYQSRQPLPAGSYNQRGVLCNKTCIHLVNFKTRAFKMLPLSAWGRRSLPRFTGGAGTVVCGVPHWVVMYNSTTKTRLPKREILYFDLEEQSFKQMVGPRTELGREKVMLGLGSLDGERQLSVVLQDTLDPICFEIWVMKEYGNLDSWTNLFVFQGDSSIIFEAVGSAITMDVLRLMENGEYLISVNGTYLWAYDPEKGSLRQMQIQMEQCRGLGFTIIANESSLINPSQGMW